MSERSPAWQKIKEEIIYFFKIASEEFHSDKNKNKYKKQIIWMFLLRNLVMTLFFLYLW